MGCEAEFEKQSNIPKLPIFSIPPMQSPQRSGMLTPPLQTSASVPFHWEQEPGKPRPCTTLITFSNPNDFFPKSLELPPRLLLPSPTTLLEGPYVGSGSNKNGCYGSFSGVERGLLGAMVLTKGEGIKDKGWLWFGSWRKKAFKVKRDVTGGSHVFPSSVHKENGVTIEVGGTHNKANMPKIKRSGVWTTIYEGLKQVVPWKSKKVKKDGSGLRL